MTKPTATLLTNIGSLVTFEPLVKEQRFHSVTEKDLGIKRNAWIAFDEKVIASGEGAPPKEYLTFNNVDAGGGLVLPGLVDCHTHPIFAGSRANEFAMRLEGATYQEIAAKGGGIKSTVSATRSASDDELKRLTLERLNVFLRHGVTAVEVKSGYGLSVKDELRLLRILNACKAETPLRLSVTCLALHAMPPGQTDVKKYVDECTNELLPQVKEEQLADCVDAFVENGYFSASDVIPYFKRAKDLGLGIRVHADEFSDSGAAALAADFGALSADHLQFASQAGIARLASAEVTAVLLPGTSLYTKIPFADARRFTSSGVTLAIATDFNPGSCKFDNLSFIASLAAVHCNLTAAQSVFGVSLGGAKALQLDRGLGSLAVGSDGSLVVYPCGSVEDWIASFGGSKPVRVYSKGVQLKSSASDAQI